MPRRRQAPEDLEDAEYSMKRLSIRHDQQTTPQDPGKFGEDPNDILLALLSQPIRPQRSSDYEIISGERVSMSEFNPDDLIIVVMGPTGVGKSTFIQTLSGDEGAVGHGLESCTSEISAYRLKCSDGINIVLVDTPGFNDTPLSDFGDLENTTRWIQDVGKRDLQVSGFLYLDRISDNRMVGAPRKALQFVEKRAGKQFFPRVTLMTTMWPDSADIAEMEESEMREAELREEYWAIMIAEGSKVARFDNNRASARRVVDGIVTAESEMRLSRIQQELVDQGKTLPATEAGQQLHAAYGDMVEKQNSLIQRLRIEMEKAAADPEMIRILQQQLRDELVKWKNARKEMEKLDSTLRKGWRRFFCLC